MFKKFVHQFHSLNVTFGNIAKVRMTHFNISAGGKPAEIKIIIIIIIIIINLFHVEEHKNLQ